MFKKKQKAKKIRQQNFVYGIMVLWLAIFIFWGCEKSDSVTSKKGESAGPLQACQLLTKTEVEAILGGVVDEPNQMFKENEKHQFWMSSCNYFAPAASKRAGLLIQKSLDTDPAKAFESHLASLKSSLGDDYNLQTIDGIGKLAGWDGPSRQLTVFEGKRMLIVTTGGPGEDERSSLETAKLISAKVLAKLH